MLTKLKYTVYSPAINRPPVRSFIGVEIAVETLKIFKLLRVDPIPA
jgi:hypothetical protein